MSLCPEFFYIIPITPHHRLIWDFFLFSVVLYLFPVHIMKIWVIITHVPTFSYKKYDGSVKHKNISKGTASKRPENTLAYISLIALTLDSNIAISERRRSPSLSNIFILFASLFNLSLSNFISSSWCLLVSLCSDKLLSSSLIKLSFLARDDSSCCQHNRIYEHRWTGKILWKY